MLEAREVTVRAGTCPIIDRVSLRLDQGELVGLLGPNGAGKSTLLRALAGVGTATAEGEVLLDGHRLDRIDPWDKARRLAYLPQDRTIAWALHVREVVALGRYPHRRALAPPSTADKAAVETAMVQTGIAAIATRPAHVLSGGEKARVLLARALAVEAPLLLADEPVAGLDPRHQLAVMELLRARARAGAGVLAVLQELPLAARFLDRVILMHRGQIVADGPPVDVLVPDRIGAVFGVRPLAGVHGGEAWLLPWKIDEKRAESPLA
ncbi:ABC transporter ATP-binding protein [Alteraurantiacibacter palmitatis]|uniref:ABC transporter ATP-binding protein n=1 Tax=Alteraurantiacibacter palmitatis TaxID=2054628 RepID=A0ABV7E8M4_9SPHN